MFLGCIYTAIALPVEIGLSQEAQVDFGFVIALVLSFLFFIDLIMNFNRAVYVERKQKWIIKRQEVARRETLEYS
eukprot:5409018-Prymnesium_polylepis.1